MKQYILHRTFITQDGSSYPQRAKPYYESELPALALTSTFAILVDDGTVVGLVAKPIERNVLTQHYNPVENKNVVEQHFQPSYAQTETIAEAQPILIDLLSLNSTDHIVEPVVLGKATVQQITALPYISRKTAEKLVQALADGKTFSSMADLDAWQRLGFGKSFADTGLILPVQEVEDVPVS